MRPLPLLRGGYCPLHLRDGSGSRRRRGATKLDRQIPPRSEEQTSELQSLMRISYAVFCLKKKNDQHDHQLFTPKTISRSTTCTQLHTAHTISHHIHKKKTY